MAQPDDELESLEDASEEIIVIDEEEAASPSNGASDTNSTASTEGNQTQRRILFGLAALLVLLLIAVIVSLLLPSDKPLPNNNFQSIDSQLEAPASEPVEPSRLEKMIAKANYLYNSGNKAEALQLYERIALYSESISHYNLGVAQLKEKQYDTALATFKKAIANGDNRCVSAINAAVCCLHLNHQQNFDYYIDLANAYLPHEIDSPLYSYYYALIQYYKGNYFEALSALNHPSSQDYTSEHHKLLSRINTLYGDYYGAITALEHPLDTKDSLSLGLLYANVGDLSLARQHLSEAAIQGYHPMLEQLALAYVNLKAGQLEDGGKMLRDVTDLYGEAVYKPYPVTVFLKDSLFEPSAAQYQYRNKASKKRTILYQKLFYFAPYKIFNAEQTINYIRKGTANIYIDDISGAKEYLSKSSRTSAINQGIAQAIQKSLEFRLRDANVQLQKLLKINPKHSILHYNLGLTYAQLGDFMNAHTHFLRSYHLDANNYLSGVFALMTAKALNKPQPKLQAIITENLAGESTDEPYELYRTLLHLNNDNLIGAARWLDKDYEERPLYLMLRLHIAKEIDKDEIAQRAAQKLTIALPNEILPHLLYVDTHFDDQPDKSYANSVLNYLKQQHFHFDDLYFGPFITRYLYTQAALITGKLHPLRMQLKNKLETTTEAPQDIMSALALASIYDRAFEESYTLYNQLIDDYKVRDPLTLFHGAVASIGANHPANAIGLLELAKLKDPGFQESRYALGLLYLQIKNHQGAGIQFQHIGNSGFHSEYFNFAINTDDLYFQYRQKASN